MIRFVKLFFLSSTLVWIFLGNNANAAPQLEEKPKPPLDESSNATVLSPVELQSFSIDQPKEMDWNEVKKFEKKYRWFGTYLEAYQGTTAESADAKTIGIVGLEYSHRYLIDMYWQTSIAFTNEDGIFFRFQNKEIIRDSDWGRTCVRYGIQHTSNPKQQFGSFLNLNNLYANLGLGFQDLFGFPEEMRLQLDAYAGTKGLGFSLGLAYENAF